MTEPEENEMAVVTRLRGASPERIDADEWFKAEAYSLGVEPGSATLDFWDGRGTDAGYVECQMACRVNGKRYEVKAGGSTHDDAARAVLGQLALEIMGNSPVSDAGDSGPAH